MKKNHSSQNGVSGRLIHAEANSNDSFVDNPAGSDYWLMIYTAVGGGRFNCAGKTIAAVPGDIFLIRPRTPHGYGVDLLNGSWKNICVRFSPPAAVEDWLDWPEIAPGHLQLRLQDEIRVQVWNSLREVCVFCASKLWRHSELAFTALEKTLLLCDSVNRQLAGVPRKGRTGLMKPELVS